MSNELSTAEMNKRYNNKNWCRGEGQRESTQSSLYWFTLPQGLRPIFLATVARKISLW